MKETEIHLRYVVYESSEELIPEDRSLLEEARNITSKAYAPYSKFHVGAAALFENGKIISGTNQENASYPVGICAERTLLSVAAMDQSGIPIKTIAISYNNTNGQSNNPISPCGMCRQSLSEYEMRNKQPIRLILSGQTGRVYIIHHASDLLPLSFGSDDLK
jgi:cytidine deaminase